MLSERETKAGAKTLDAPAYMTRKNATQRAFAVSI